MLYVDKVESPHGLRISSHIGSFNPSYATGLGKVLLAFLSDEVRDNTLEFIFNQEDLKSYTNNTIIDKKQMIGELELIRANQYAIDREEFEIGLICIAIPIFNQNQDVVASLSASGPASRFKEDEIQKYVDTLKKGAIGIQEKIGTFKLL